ncbi:E3 SUMO-protein ligase KIAA1586-like isoform X2 [Ruditapes philippinarum]|uniref:E3 SUMO-protein ligase KIAA1586-like isoform X2 n=1 Tax=Ruditapes philippinarum TaxID=129788 RepID=UPI00295BAD17|nr:E3 SUMO-protein ligase KIAA1586-like isoform X2 [Ruditapes philippinarum]
MFTGTPTSSTGKDIFDYIDSSLKNLDDGSETYWNKIAGFCSDGASNMQGKNMGVAAFVRQQNRETLVMHCMAHRVELAYKDAVKKLKLYDKAVTLLLGLYYLYRKSPKMKQELKRSFSILDKRVVLPTRIGGTRWLPHIYRAISVFLKGYQAFKLHLETSSHKNPKADGLARILLDASVFVFILDLKVILQPLIKLSLMLQERSSTLADNFYILQATTDALMHMKSKVW